MDSLSNFLLLTMFLLCASSTIVTDKESLISFKSQVFTEYSNDPLSDWDDDGRRTMSPCNWTGVTCAGQRVVGLNLSGLRLSGSISPWLGNLSSLESLELQKNQLTGAIPDQLGKLFRLRTLNLSYNELTGAIPLNVSRWRDLQWLDLSMNRIQGRIPPDIGGLSRLRVLNLGSNNLSGNLPSSLTNISSLEELKLSTDNLNGPLPRDLDRLSKLKILYLMANDFSGSIPDSLYNMSSLAAMAFAENDLHGEVYGDIGIRLPNLVEFWCCFNKFTGKIPWSLHNLTNIKAIRMAHNRLHGGVPPGLGNLPYLEMYNIADNNIVSSGEGGIDFIESLTNSTRLNFLAFDNNGLEGRIPTSIGNLSKSLTKLYMENNKIYGHIPSSIGELQALGILNMSYNSISGEIPREIGLLKGLITLGLADNKLSGKIPDSLGNLHSLQKLDLSKNQLLGRIPNTLENLQDLIFMDLSRNKLNGSIPSEIVRLPRLSSFLNLSNNHLTGPLPKEIQLLEDVQVIDVSDNKLCGSIPQSIKRCKSLLKLSLARNMISGQIPDGLESIIGLEILDLSSNHLSGVIPLSLKNLRSLELLNLSYNHLEGNIPSGGVFSDLSKVHLENNSNLCPSGLSCKTRHARSLSTTNIILISVAIVVTALCFSIGLIYWFQIRGKGAVEDSFTSFVEKHPMITYNEIRAATNGFSEENLISRGSFGLVYKGFLHGGVVAIKVLDGAITTSHKAFLSECAALRHKRHLNLIKLITVCSGVDSKNDAFFALIIEFMSNGSLDEWITGKRRHSNKMGLSIHERLECAIRIASAMDYLHNGTDVPIVHCDLKPSNVLLASNMVPKVADFGIAKIFFTSDDHSEASVSSAHTLKGSIGYIPPEYGYGGKPSTAGDMYSYGILLLELFTGRSPTHESFVHGLSLTSWVHKHFPDSIEKVLDPELPEQFKVFHYSNNQQLQHCLITIFGVALSCTAESPAARPTVREVLRRMKVAEEILAEENELVDANSMC